VNAGLLAGALPGLLDRQSPPTPWPSTFGDPGKDLIARVQAGGEVVKVLDATA